MFKKIRKLVMDLLGLPQIDFSDDESEADIIV